MRRLATSSIYFGLMRTFLSYITVLLSLGLPSAAADCPQPSIPVEVYVLSSLRTSYAPGSIYEAVCTPGYTPSSISQLSCDSSGSWIGRILNCEKDERGGRWWMFLVVVVTVIILIPCTVPRIYFYCLEEPSEIANTPWSRLRLWMASSHVPGFKRQMKTENSVLDSDDVELDMCPKSLPPVKLKSYSKMEDTVPVVT